MNFPIDNNGCIWWFVWAHSVSVQMADELKKEMQRPECKTLYLIGFEEYEIIYIFNDKNSWKEFLAFANENNVNVYLFRPAYLGKLNHRHYITQGKNLVQFMHYFANAVLHSHIDRNWKLHKVNKPKKLFTSLNNRGHPHRCIFMDMLYKNKCENYGHISWSTNNISQEHQWKYFTDYMIAKRLDWKGRDGEILYPPEQFSDSALSVVCESNTECLFMTEKTFVPILHQRPFITFSVPNYHKALVELGFDLYDNLFDYSFDSIEDDEARADAMWQQVAKYKDHNYSRIYDACEYKIKHNFQHLIEMIKSTENIFPPEVYKNFSTTNNEHFNNHYKDKIFFDSKRINKWIIQNG